MTGSNGTRQHHSHRPGVLYISYDGLLEPLGYSQVFQYLRLLAPDYRISLITFEKASDWADQQRVAAMKSAVQQAGIHWVPLRYHKRPSALATSYDIAHGMWVGARLVILRNLSIVHARSYVPAVIGLGLKKLLRRKFLFDMRGFWADERVDGGLWRRESQLYRIAKWFEARFLANADAIVSLTEAAVREMNAWPSVSTRKAPFFVITTCTDLDLFRPAVRSSQPRFVLGYVGNLGTWYLLDPVFLFFAVVRRLRPDARLLFITRDDPERIRARAVAFEIPLDVVEIRSATPEEVPGQIAKMTASAFFLVPAFSKKASAPTKLGELLACGVPCVTNVGTGDVEEIVVQNHVGAVVRDFSPPALEQACRALLELIADHQTPQRCRAVAERLFSLSEGARKYSEIYSRLARADKRHIS